MPQLDVYRAESDTLLLDCQSAALGHLATRPAAPLLPLDRAPARRARLNPPFEIDGQSYVMVTQFTAAVGSNDLRTKVTNLTAFRHDITDAFDMLPAGV